MKRRREDIIFNVKNNTSHENAHLVNELLDDIEKAEKRLKREMKATDICIAELTDAHKARIADMKQRAKYVSDLAHAEIKACQARIKELEYQLKEVIKNDCLVHEGKRCPYVTELEEKNTKLRAICDGHVGPKYTDKLLKDYNKEETK